MQQFKKTTSPNKIILRAFPPRQTSLFPGLCNEGIGMDTILRSGRKSLVCTSKWDCNSLSIWSRRAGGFPQKEVRESSMHWSF